MNKIIFATAILFAVPLSSFAYSIGLDSVVVPCGAQSVALSGSADYSDGQYGPIPNAQLVVLADYKVVKVVNDGSKSWAVSVPVSGNKVIVDVKIIAPQDGIDYQAGTVMASHKEIDVPACDSAQIQYVPPAVTIPAPQKSADLTVANRNLIEQFIRFLQAVLAR